MEFSAAECPYRNREEITAENVRRWSRIWEEEEQGVCDVEYCYLVHLMGMIINVKWN